MSRTPRIVLAALTVALVAVLPAGGALVAPVLTGPDAGATVDALPAFKWDPVDGRRDLHVRVLGRPGLQLDARDHHDEEHARDAQDAVPERDLLLARPGELVDGRARRLVRGAPTRRGMGAEPRRSWPRPTRATITYPSEALELKWDVVPGASKYYVKVATDPELASLLWDGEPIETAATQFSLSKPVAPGDVLLGHRPARRRGARRRAVRGAVVHLGLAVRRPTRRSPISWPRPSSSTRKLSWDPVEGAAGYDVEINFSSDWSGSSKVCCDPIKGQIDTLGTALMPTTHLANNTYYWRVRAIDAANNAGRLERGPDLHEDVRQRPAGHRARASRTSACATTSPTRPSTPTGARPSSTRTSRSSPGTRSPAPRATRCW